MEKKACLIRIKGKVTGVGFRWFTLDMSSKYKSITGYVRNLCSGEVEALIQGSFDEVELMIQGLKIGPPYAKVDSIEITPVKFDETIKNFTIR
ncbi:MAG TPA: acylphosphatase [Victivallales bacterium]|nr:acylphosphatase [Victivallales bacterium]HRR06764.1 acylphosphatase [Victivallales bacterium]HRR28962.1 acylphosphatase [Victivallales bacterium]HRU01267.1 acylphosphatase [Victivallales bacterium]